MKSWKIIADNLSEAVWSWGRVSAIDSNGRTIRQFHEFSRVHLRRAKRGSHECVSNCSRIPISQERAGGVEANRLQSSRKRRADSPR